MTSINSPSGREPAREALSDDEVETLVRKTCGLLARRSLEDQPPGSVDYEPGWLDAVGRQKRADYGEQILGLIRSGLTAGQAADEIEPVPTLDTVLARFRSGRRPGRAEDDGSRALRAQLARMQEANEKRRATEAAWQEPGERERSTVHGSLAELRRRHGLRPRHRPDPLEQAADG